MCSSDLALLLSTVVWPLKLALEIERRFIVGALGGTLTSLLWSCSSDIGIRGVGGGGNSGVGQVTVAIPLIGDGGGGKFVA